VSVHLVQSGKVDSICDVNCQENVGRGGRVSGSKPVLVSGESKVFVGDWQESFFENFDGWAEERDRSV
jgi:hypothetical protein